jgi:hypothetical protein
MKIGNRRGFGLSKRAKGLSPGSGGGYEGEKAEGIMMRQRLG